MRGDQDNTKPKDMHAENQTRMRRVDSLHASSRDACTRLWPNHSASRSKPQEHRHTTNKHSTHSSDLTESRRRLVTQQRSLLSPQLSLSSQQLSQQLQQQLVARRSRQQQAQLRSLSQQLLA
eukprot:m.527185 g.527185  ORF g.527185 m.527185 type:complete len:122 (-) comp57558_c0_seq1:2161-2526(-)